MSFFHSTVTMTKISSPLPAPTAQTPAAVPSPDGEAKIDDHLTGVQNVACPPLQRSLSTPMPATRPLLAGLHVLDSLVHPTGIAPARHPGSLALGHSKVSAWKEHQCAPESLLGRIEMHQGRGVLTLFASPRFASGELSQTSKRELERAVIATLAAYNQARAPRDSHAQPASLTPRELPVSLHENHLTGDGQVHADRQIPRVPNPRDYDFYHTLGVPFAENGRMHPHYHLEFNGPLTRTGVGDILDTLHSMGRVIEGHEIISADDIEPLLSLLPKAADEETSCLEAMQRHRPRIPGELHAVRQQVRARDELRGEVHALASSNTEKHSDARQSSLRRNMHMNSLRPLEPECLLACFSLGYTSLQEDLEQIESVGKKSHPPPSSRELLDLLAVFNRALDDLAGVSPASAEERAQAQAMTSRLQNAACRTKALLMREERRPGLAETGRA